MNKKAAIYIRVSTSHQIDKDSLPFQRKELCDYAKYALDIDDYVIFEDAGYSAKNTDRPDYQNMIKRIHNKEFSHLLVWKIDRISRNLKDFTEMYDELKHYDVTFISKMEQFDTSSAMGEAMLKIILVFAELERKLTAERVFSIMMDRAEKGLWNGATVPLGYRWDDETKYPTVDEEEAQVVRYIFDLYDKLRSTSKVAHRLNYEDVPTKRDGTWVAKTISGILRNPFYIGTYRYNVRDNNTGRLKKEDEWVVVENNHDAIISVEQFERANAMIEKNRRREFDVPIGKNVHVFARIITCGKCGSIFSAGLDTARKDGYRPSRYTCSTRNRYNYDDSCKEFISDKILMPFIMNYIANFLNARNRVTAQHSLRDIERILLRGSAFVDVTGIDRDGLEQTYLSFTKTKCFEQTEYEDSGYIDDTSNNPENFDEVKLQREKKKYETALKRLEDLYLFSDDAMSEKDYLFKKRDLSTQLDKIKKNILSIRNRNNNHMNFDFVNKASYLIIMKELTGKRNIDYMELIKVVDLAIVRDFVHSLIKTIVVKDHRILSITFINGMTHKFSYKDSIEMKHKPHKKLLYLEYVPAVVNYLEENGSISRREIENLVNVNIHGALKIVEHLVKEGLIEVRGTSVARRYYYTKK